MATKRMKDLTQDEAQKLLDAFNSVFSQSGDNLNCGREKCIELITLLNQYFGINCGDVTNGFLEFEEVKSIRSKLVHRCKILGILDAS